MNILVCIKAVLEQPVWGGDGTLDRAKGGLSLNAADCGALSAALELKKRTGGVVTVLSMGTLSALPLLRDLNALDTDRVVLLSDPRFAGSDTLVTASILTAAAKKLGPFDLVLTGRSSADGETGHVGAQMAVLLNCPCLTNVTSLRGEPGAGVIRCDRLLEDSVRTLEADLPAVVTLCSGHTLPPPSLKGLRGAKERQVEVLNGDDLNLDEGAVGQKGAMTRVVKTSPVEKPRSRCRFFDSCSAGADEVLRLLRELPRRREPNLREGEAVRLKGTALVVSLEDSLSQRAAQELAAKAETLFEDVSLIRAAGGGADDRCVARAICRQVERQKPDCVLIPATIRARCVAPLCAAMLGAGLTADCTQLAVRDGELVMIRPTFGGTLMAEIVSRRKPWFASVRPGVFAAEETTREPIQLEAEDDGCVRELDRRAFGLRASPGEAKIILSGGKGIGGESGFRKLEELAGRLGAVVCASRAAVDSGWHPYPYQVGQTGTAVRPDVYIACGISGAVQHMMGVRGGLLIAVNPDRKAPIFDYADIGILADWSEFADQMMQKT